MIELKVTCMHAVFSTKQDIKGISFKLLNDSYIIITVIYIYLSTSPLNLNFL